jgi:adenylate cyclase
MKPVAALGPRCGGGDENTYNGSRAQVVNVAAEWRRLEDHPDVIRTSEISGTGLSLRHLKATNFVRGIGVRQVRLVCGLILFCYLLSHYINHSLGNVSLDAMEYGLWFHVALWHSVVGTLLLYAALAVHGSLGLWALYQRRYFRWRTAESVQLALGLSIPALMCAHLIGERLGATLYGLERSYAQALYNFWVARPDLGVMQTVLLLVAWIHGCIGVYFWLRLKRFFPKMAPSLLGLAVLLPVLALLGFYQQGKTVELLAKQPEWRAQIQSPARIGTVAERDNLIRLRDCFLIFYAGAIALVFAARGVRLINERRGGMIRLTYPDRAIRVPKGLTVLEASYRHRVPHANVCGGKGRCSTCRIRIVSDRSGLPEPSAREAFVLERVGASGDPAVRLACQLRPYRDITIVPLLPPQVSTSFVHGKTRVHPGEERYIVSMFVDMRGSTQMAADQLPFDTVFIVNRFLGAISQAVIRSGGNVNQDLGDGLLALFGVDTDSQSACRQALKAAAMVAKNVETLNQQLAGTERNVIRFGIGINGGEVIIGDVGHGENIAFTALGDAVNVAARLQDMSKELECEVVISDEVYQTAGLPHDGTQLKEITVRGRTAPIVVRTVLKAENLATLFERATAGSAAAA